MDRRSIVTKTGKGLMEATGKTSDVSRDLRNILKEIDGQISVSSLLRRLDDLTEPKLLEALAKLEREGYVREFLGQQDDGPPSRPVHSQSSKPAAGGGDLDFTDLAARAAKRVEDVTKLNTQAQDIARQAQATRAREDAAKAGAQPTSSAAALDRARREAEERAHRDAEDRARRVESERIRLEAEERARQEIEERKKREIADRIRREEEERARREAEERARKQAEEQARRELEERVRREAGERARREAEERARREVEDRARREVDARARMEIELKARLDAEDRARREADERAVYEKQERARREEDLRRRAEQDTRARQEDTRARQEDTRARQEDERRRQEEQERREREELERSFREQEEAVRRDDENRRREAKERARQEEERIRREWEERERIEAERQAAEESARQAEQEEERAEEEKAAAKAAEEEEARRRRAAEKEAKARAKAEAKAAKQAQKDARAREKAQEKERKRAETARKREAAATARGTAVPARAAWAKRKPAGLGKMLGSGLVAVLVVGAAVLPFVSLDPLPYQKSAEAWLGQPVSIGSVSVAYLPRPRLKLEKVVIGTDPKVRVAVIRAIPGIGSLFSDHKTFSSLELEGLSLPRQVMPALLSAVGRRDSLRVGRITAKAVKLDVAHLPLPDLDVDARLAEDGTLQSMTLSGGEHKLVINVVPQGGNATIDASADEFTLPIGGDLVLDDFSAKGTISPNELVLAKFDGRALGGRATGSARVRWSDGWSLDGTIEAHDMRAGSIAATLIDGGTLAGKGSYSAKALVPDRLFMNARMEGSFTVDRGSIRSVDMTSALHGDSIGGQTPFSQMSGNVFVDPDRVSVRQLRVVEGPLNAVGQVDMDALKNLSGRVQVELRATTVQARAIVTVSGTLQQPRFRHGS